MKPNYQSSFILPEISRDSLRSPSKKQLKIPTDRGLLAPFRAVKSQLDRKNYIYHDIEKKFYLNFKDSPEVHFDYIPKNKDKKIDDLKIDNIIFENEAYHYFSGAKSLPLSLLTPGKVAPSLKNLLGHKNFDSKPNSTHAFLRSRSCGDLKTMHSKPDNSAKAVAILENKEFRKRSNSI